MGLAVVDAIGGPRRTAVIGCLLLFSLLILIAGSIMLGIGISKLNESRSDSNSKLFVLNVRVPNVTNDDLNDYSNAVNSVKETVLGVVGKTGDVIVLGLSKSSSQVWSRGFEANDSPRAILSISYPGSEAPNKAVLTKKFEDGNFVVNNLYDSSFVPNSIDQQLCKPSTPNNDDTTTTTSDGTTTSGGSSTTTDGPVTTTTTHRPIPNDTYAPCEGTFVFMLDYGKGSEEVFKSQIDFVSNKLFTGNFNHFERLTLGTYSHLASVENPGFFKNLQSVQDYLNGHTQNANENSPLRTALKELTNLEINEKNLQFIVFASNLTLEKVEDASEWTETLQKSGGVTIVSLEKVSNLEEIKKSIGANVVVVDANSNRDEYEKLFYDIYNCKNANNYKQKEGENNVEEKNVIVRSKRSVDFEALAKDDDNWTPCKGQISFILDTSSDISEDDFNKQKTFFTSQLLYGWTHLERLILGYYNNLALVEAPGRIVNSKHIDNWFDELKQAKTKSNIRLALKEIVDGGSHQRISHLPQYYIVFVSEITQQIVDEVQPYVKDFRGDKLTFVAVNGADVGLLKKLTPDVIQWDRGQYAPSNWEKSFWSAYGCGGNPPNGPTTTTNVPTTTTTIRTTTTTSDPSAPYEPCRKQVYIVVDSSGGQTEAQFNAQKDVIVNKLLSTFNHFERISIGHYDELPNINSPGTFKSINAVKDELDTINRNSNQMGRKPMLRRVYDYFSRRPYNTEITEQTIIIFTSAIDQDMVDDTKEFYSDIQQYAHVSLIGLNNNVDVNLLKQLAFNAFTFDVTSPPSNIDDKLQGAVLC
ncbi:unnamed protein product [Bursaphelenchus okinawaensis]|uniref:VWFA domain-containing protein n=1 Tax=Bursaphelenchus okinawaensis TaxID=465554 RepID=A0A811LL96_9BILA|nr:unnamed protein product [Bursaphelenchus okinawaensis]CAG9123781.1 unnamed protein product [Bursaphelenchus okinawaensis]